MGPKTLGEILIDSLKTLRAAAWLENNEPGLLRSSRCERIREYHKQIDRAIEIAGRAAEELDTLDRLRHAMHLGDKGQFGGFAPACMPRNIPLKSPVAMQEDANKHEATEPD